MRNHFLRVLVVGLILGLGAFWATANAAEETYPSKTVTIIIPFSPGGGGDIWMRLVTAVATNYFNVPVVAINIAGADGALGVRKGLSAPADDV